MDSTQYSASKMANQQAPKGAIWPVDVAQSQALRKELYDYYWPKLKMLWKPKTHFHWAKTVQFMRYFMKDLEFPIPTELIMAAIDLGNSNRGWSEEEQATVEQICLASIWDSQNVYPMLQDHATLRKGLEEMKAQLEGIDWIPKGYDASNLNKRLEKCDQVTSEMYEEYLQNYKDFQRPGIDYAYWDEREYIEETRTVKLEELDIYFQDIHREQVDEDNPHPICTICQQPLIDSQELHNLFKFAEIVDAKISPHGSWPEKEAWSKNLEAAMLKFQNCDHSDQENRLIWEICQPIYDLQNAYYRLRNARSFLPEVFCVQPVRLRCGHKDFGRQCVTTWVVDRHVDEVTKRLNQYKTTCPLCRQPMAEDMDIEIIYEEEDEEEEEGLIRHLLHISRGQEVELGSESETEDESGSEYETEEEDEPMQDVVNISSDEEDDSSSDYEPGEDSGSEHESGEEDQPMQDAVNISNESDTESESGDQPQQDEDRDTIGVAPAAPQPHPSVQWTISGNIASGLTIRWEMLIRSFQVNFTTEAPQDQR